MYTFWLAGTVFEIIVKADVFYTKIFAEEFVIFRFYGQIAICQNPNL